jgi:2-dehydro-3-deoxygluconokinase
MLYSIRSTILEVEMATVVTFGEIMLRLAPPGFGRIIQTRAFEAVYGGGEANVAASIANFGESTQYVTRLPMNDLGDACIAFLRSFNIGTRHIVRGGDRLGIYFLESGAAQRGSKVIYDRAGSAFASLQPGMVNWKAAFDNADWFHWTGITPAVSQSAAAVCREGIEAARQMGLTVSCDMNYRAKLWKWGKPAGEVMQDLVAMSDVAIGNEEDADKVFGIKAPGADVVAGKIEPENYRIVCENLAKRFTNLQKIAITLRGSLSASQNTWSAVLWSPREFFKAPTYTIDFIVDRVGSGDAFMGGLIYGLRKYSSPDKALRFAVAASCLKHTIAGDFNQVTVAEVEALMAGDASGRVSR